jgi:glutamine synthetase
MTPREVLALCREKDVKAVDLRYTELAGAWQRLTIPVGQLDESVFEDGVALADSAGSRSPDGGISDLLALPQPGTAFIDPFAAVPTLGLVCNLQDPATGEPYIRDPRHMAIKAANYLKATGIADAALFAPEPQFYVFESARFAAGASESFYHLAPPDEDLADLRSEMMQAMLDCSLEVQSHGGQCGTLGRGRSGPCRIGLHQQPLLAMADSLQTFKHCVRSVARRHGKSATFMPQPLAGEQGSAMHLGFSLWRDEEPLLAGGSYAGLSEIGFYAIGGILKHAPALAALTNPTTNSYKRLASSDAPARLTYSQQQRSAACRVPQHSQSPRQKQIELRFPDATGNPYVALAAITMAAIDGIQLKLSPGQPLDREFLPPSPEQLAELRQMPMTLDEALAALQRDCDFLLHDDVFTADVINAWIQEKRSGEVNALRQRPHPYEFFLYFDA